MYNYTCITPTCRRAFKSYRPKSDVRCQTCIRASSKPSGEADKFAPQAMEVTTGLVFRRRIGYSQSFDSSRADFVDSIAARYKPDPLAGIFDEI